MKVNRQYQLLIIADGKWASQEGGEEIVPGYNSLYDSPNAHFKAKRLLQAQVLIIAVCISLHVVEIQLEAASSFTSALFEIFANFILAIAFKKVIATEQKLPSVSTANGTIDALE